MKPSLLPILPLVLSPVLLADVRYVDPDAPGLGTGLDWENAFHDLQQALDAALADPSIDEVRVAGSEVYRPSVETIPGDPRSACFVIPDQVSVLGGYAGWGEPEPDFRSPNEQYICSLSGDLLQNDFGTSCSSVYSGQADNAYHIVDLSDSDYGTVFDGFRLSHGVADGPAPYDCGAAIYMVDSEARVRNCRFYLNYAAGDGGAIYRLRGAGRFDDCLFRYNEAAGDGGSIWSTGPWDLLVTRCSFEESTAGGDGGAVFSAVSDTEILNCEFWECVAGARGGAILGSPPEVRVLGSTLASCRADQGGGVFSEGEIGMGNSVMQGIVGWSSSGADNFLHSDAGVVLVLHSCVRDFLFPGPGNIDDPPLFVDANLGTCTPDLSLQPGSPCIDAGDNQHQLQFGPLDLLRLPRYTDDPSTPDTGSGSGSAPVVDMGAIEFQPVDLGQAFCFGDGTAGADCPCGNTAVAGEGCEHSGGVGMWITAAGSASLSADDLTIVVHQVPPGNAGLIYSGTIALPVPNVIWDGLQCTLGATRRYQPQFQTDGVFTDTGFVAQDPSGDYFAAGGTYHFQLWTRDAAAPSPCGTGATYSPTWRVTMGP